MDDRNINKELRQKLSFSCCEEETQNEGQKKAQRSREAQSQTPEKSEVQDSETMLTLPRAPLSNMHELSTPREKDKENSDQILRTPGSHLLKCPETPGQPGNRNKLPHGASPSTPKSLLSQRLFFQWQSFPPEALSIWGSYLLLPRMRLPHWLWSILIPSLQSPTENYSFNPVSRGKFKMILRKLVQRKARKNKGCLLRHAFYEKPTWLPAIKKNVQR